MDDHGSDDNGWSEADGSLLRQMTHNAEQQASRLASVLQCTPDHLYLYDRDGRFVYVSDAALRALGLTLSEMVGHTGGDLGFPADFMDVLDSARERALGGGGQSSGEVVFPTVEGPRDFEYTLAPVAAGDGVPTGVVVTVRDVTERNRVAATLMAEKAFNDTVIDAAPGLFYTIDRMGHLIRWNGAVERFTGRAHDAVAGMEVYDIVAPQDVERARAAVAEVFERGSIEIELRLVGVDGPRDHIFTGMRTEIAGAPYLVGYGIDVTERVAAEAEVREGRDELERRVEARTRELEAANLRLRRTERALLTLSWSNQTLVRAVDEQQLLQDVCDAAVEVGGYRMAWVGYLEHDDGRAVRPVAFAGAEKGFFKEIAVSWGDGPTGQGTVGRSVRDLRPAIVPDTAADPSYAPWREAAVLRGYGSVVSLPLLDTIGDPFGVFCVYAGEKNAFDDREVALLEELSMDLAFGIDSLHGRQKQAQAEEQLQASYAQLEHLTRDVVASMGRIVEARDPYTQGHERRVAELAKLIATEMGLSDDEVAAIEMAALLHDIGKLCVPAEILTKPGTLSLSEFDLIKDHSRRGYEILKDISFPWPIADIVLQHHERMDGSGYPEEVQGPEILMASRILAVADVIEAMASHRPYRPLIGLEQAMEEIRTRVGAYDPEVAKACERLYERGAIEL